MRFMAGWQKYWLLAVFVPVFMLVGITHDGHRLRPAKRNGPPWSRRQKRKAKSWSPARPTR